MVLLLLYLTLVSFMRLTPLPLRFPLCLPCRGLDAALGGRLWTHVGIRVSRTAHHAIPDLAFGDIDLLPVLRTVAELLLLRHMQPGEEGASLA